MESGKALDGKPYAGNPHVRFDEVEVASCTAEASLRRVHCRRRSWCCTLAVFVAISLCVGKALAATNVINYNTAGGVLNYGSETHIEKTSSSQRILVKQGTVNINEGAYFKVGGNSNGDCNFIGIENNNPAAMNINGGTVWCTTSGGGAGVLAVGSGIGKSNTSTLTLNSGVLKVDAVLRSSTQWNDAEAVTASGTVVINGGEATVGTVYMGGPTVSTGTSTLTLNGGTLTVNNITFRSGNGQVFTYGNGTLVANQANIFTVNAYDASNTKTRTMQITGNPASFDTAGYAQTIPAFTGTGKLRLTGGGVVTFEQSTLTYGLIFDGIELNLGTLDASAVRLTTSNLEIIGPATLNVTLPASPSGRYPLIACTSSLDGSLGQITVSGGGEGILVRDGKTLYLSFDAADADDALVYSAAAGGADTPAATSYTRLAFAGTAGAFTVGGDSLTLSQDIADESASPQTVTAPVTLSTGSSSIYVAEGGKLTLSGGLTATTPRKDGPGTLVLDSATMPSTIVPREGILDLGGNTLSGKLDFSSRRYNGEEIMLTNGVWRMSGDWNWQGSTVTVADGFTVDLATSNKRIGIGYGGVDGDGAVTTKLIVDGGTVRTAGNRGGSCNFVGVDKWGTAILEVKRGTFHANGSDACIRIGVNDRTSQTGIVRVSGGLFKVDNDLSLATVHSGTGGATSNGRFEQSGGTASVGNFYLGGTSSKSGSGTVNLTGGVLEVGCLKCLAYNTQTLVADGGTIRATSADTAAAPFLAKVASADSYAKTYTIGAGGLTIDTAGYDVHCEIPWTGTGGLTVMGDGSLALAQTLAVAGDSVISNGTTLVITNSIAFGGKVALGTGAKIRFDTTSFTEDSLVFATTDGFTLPDGATDVLDFVEIVGDSYVASVNDDGDTITLGLAANIAAFAWWTGNGDPTDFDDPANWACTNSAGGMVENALPVKSTVVVLSGTTSFTVPVGTTPVWATTQIGNGGAVTLGADCDWSAAPGVTIADGSYIDLAGHSLKISNLTAADGYDAAYVTNSVAGVKPALWAENKFAETDYIDTKNVTVYTDCVEVKSVNNATFTAAMADFATTLDAAVVVTGGTMTVNGAGHNDPDATYLGVNGHTATVCLSNSAAANFRGIRLGNEGTSSGSITVADSATLNLYYMHMGYHNSGTSLFTQDGGTVTVGSKDLNVGLGNSGTARYEMNGGTLTVTGSFVPGRGESGLTGSGLFLQSGGTVNAKGYLTIGYGGGDGTYRMTGGELFATNKNVIIAEGSGSTGLFDIAGGVATCTNDIVIGRTSGRTGTLCVRNGGRLVAKTLYKGDGSAVVEFDGGILEAAADAPELLKNVGRVSFGADGLTLDTAGHDIGITNCVMYATPGARAITLTGGGTLDFTDTTLDFSEPLTGNFTFAKVADGSAATFTGIPTLADGVRGYKIRLSDNGKEIKVVGRGFVLVVQ